MTQEQIEKEFHFTLHICALPSCRSQVRSDKAVKMGTDTEPEYYHRHCWQSQSIKTAIRLIHNEIKPRALQLHMIRKMRGKI